MTGASHAHTLTGIPGLQLGWHLGKTLMGGAHMKTTITSLTQADDRERHVTESATGHSQFVSTIATVRRARVET